MDKVLQLIHFLTSCDVRLTEGTCHRHGILVEAQPDSWSSKIELKNNLNYIFAKNMNWNIGK